MSALLGRVQSLWRYPVKSLRGESLEALEFDARGAAHDREYALRTEDGGLASGKTTRRFRRVDGLFELSARWTEAGPCLRFPDGAERGVEDPELHPALERALGQPLRLLAEEGVSHFDQQPVHLCTLASLRALGEALDSESVDERRFRPNLVLDVEGEARLEETWIGHELAIGPDLRLAVLAPTQRCRMIGLPQAELAPDERLLPRLARATAGHFGVYAAVTRAGRARVGESVRV